MDGLIFGYRTCVHKINTVYWPSFNALGIIWLNVIFVPIHLIAFIFFSHITLLRNEFMILRMSK